ncbi:MAG: hypothetical protein JWQ89_4309 [Devosia sp.]|uniref:hypothetical protein n=1 Tax=Devosia sp. TaxID=1871048 RepID=UPI00260D2DEF|nr:hypothetical protein [Devosia sp.]MDB5542582.1 hypothetical protein [Devosia sp.]
MAHFFGDWGTPTIDGPQELTVGGRVFHVPEDCKIKIVTATGGNQVAHVKVGRCVAVLSVLGQLIETEQQARKRAMPQPWQDIVAS